MIFLIYVAQAIPLSSVFVLKGDVHTIVSLVFLSILASKIWMDFIIILLLGTPNYSVP